MASHSFNARFSHRKHWIILGLLLCLAGGLWYTYSQSRSYPYQQDPADLQLGDWVFRHGTSLESHVISQASDSAFSHIGMVVALQPQVMIAHATTSDHATLKNQVLLSTWDEFATPRLANRLAIARPQFLSPAQQQRIVARVKQQIGQPFVLQDQNRPHLYCTTLLANAIAHEHPAFAPRWQHMQQPLAKGLYLYPQAFAEYPKLEWIVR